MLQKTTNLLDEAERALLGSPTGRESSPQGRDSNLLNSLTPGKDVFGQREIDSDEMNEEMMDEHAANLVQPGWKISDNATPSASNFNSETPSSKAVSSTEAESA